MEYENTTKGYASNPGPQERANGLLGTPRMAYKDPDMTRENRMHDIAEKGIMARLANIQSLVGLMETHLAPVCRPSEPQAIGAEMSELIPSRTPVAETFNLISRELQSLQNRIDRLMSRIEL